MSATPFDRLAPGDTADRLIARSQDDRLVIEAKRPAAQHWLVRVDRDLAGTPAGRVARATFDESGAHDGDDWLVAHRYVRDLAEVLAQGDAERLLELVADHTTTKNRSTTP